MRPQRCSSKFSWSVVLLPLALGGCSGSEPATSETGGAGNGVGADGSDSEKAIGGASSGGAKTSATKSTAKSSGNTSKPRTDSGDANGGSVAAGSSNAGRDVSLGGSKAGSSVSLGGAKASSGASLGGTSTSGSKPADTGGAPTAGTSATAVGEPSGGSGAGAWSFAEDPGASCSVGAMPSASALTASNKLPDPFKKLDGKVISSKTEWLCRREEILQQGYEFVYGKKPKPEATAVTGTVSGSSISVNVTDAGKSGKFSAQVTLPSSGQKPYPAIIAFGGLSGMPVSGGIATINFDAMSVGMEGNGTNPGSGAFYSIYGAEHEAGLLAAWAWGISRIIDVIEKNPGTIDPTKIAVTGCSRFGKGAFVAGVLDNRIALTIPVESGVGGTPALRLIEKLDSYSGAEWPYHAISYQQWFSPEKLGQFTTGNSASADNTDKLPVDMHEMMALIIPRGLYIVDNPSTTYNGLDRNAAYVTGQIGKMIFEALGFGDNLTYAGASGSHCQWRSQYTAPLQANLDKFLLGKASTTGTVTTDLGGTKPDPKAQIEWTAPTLSGDL